MSRAFGVTAGLDPEIASPLADRCQELGYHSIWSNDHPGAKGLETLAAYAKGADRIDLGVAVIALDRQSPEEIASDIERLGIDTDRLWLGVGAGFTEKPLTTMREALPGSARGAARRPPGAGRRWARRCARSPARSGTASSSTGSLPSSPREAREWVEQGARDAGREPPTVFGYVRTAVGTGRGGSARQGRVLLPGHASGLPQPLRPAGSAGGHRGRRRRERRRRAGGALPLPRPRHPSWSGRSPARRSRT